MRTATKMPATKKTVPAAKPAAKVSPAEQRRQVLLHALHKYADKEKVREKLPVAPFDVSVEITGEINGKPHAEQFHGQLCIAGDFVKNSSSACDTNHLVAYLLSQIDEKNRGRILAHLPEVFAESQTLPEVGSVMLAEAKSLLERLRTKTPSPCAGPVSLSYAKPT